MALAAADLTTDLRWNLGGGKQIVFGIWTPSGTYTSGGEDLTRAIALAGLGLKKITNAIFGPLCPDTPTTFAGVVFDHKSTATSWGKIHVLNAGVAAHTHDIKAIGGLTSSEPLFLDASQSFGKLAATNRTIVGSTSATTGGVVAATAVAAAAEAAAATDFATLIYRSRFVIFGNH